MYSESEAALSLLDVAYGAAATSHSLNKVIFGVFKKFLDYFEIELKAIDKEIPIHADINGEKLRQSFTDVINAFEARERRLYSAVAFRQRGKVPLRLSPDIITKLQDKAWLLTNPNFTEVINEDAVFSASSEIEKVETKKSHKTILAGIQRFTKSKAAPVSESEMPVDAQALETEAKDTNKLSAAEKQAINQIKDIYHASMVELIQTCEESLMGLTSILDLYRHMRQNVNIKDFDLTKITPHDNVATSTPHYNRLVVRAATNLKRNITSKYFQAEVNLKMNNEDDGVRVLRGYFHTPAAAEPQPKQPAASSPHIKH